MTIYAKQVPPEYQESPLYLSDWAFDSINVFGNRQYNERTTVIFDLVRDSLDDLYSCWCDTTTGNPWYNTWADALADMVPPGNGRGPYTRQERKTTWPALLERWITRTGTSERAILCDALELVTGTSYETATISGSCQGDWQYIIFPANAWSADALRAFEAEYFNTGTEWIVHDGPEAPETPDDIEGFSVYVHGWGENALRIEIADAAGCSPDEITLYEFDGWTRTAKWRAM